jgi:hypothetical protein
MFEYPLDELRATNGYFALRLSFSTGLQEKRFFNILVLHQG